jgi:hypothetical protein
LLPGQTERESAKQANIENGEDGFRSTAVKLHKNGMLPSKGVSLIWETFRAGVKDEKVERPFRSYLDEFRQQQSRNSAMIVDEGMNTSFHADKVSPLSLRIAGASSVSEYNGLCCHF